MIETLLGGLLGGAFRLAPEVLKWFDRKAERSHELSMLSKNMEIDKMRGEQALAQLDVQREISMVTAGLAALQEAVRGQFQLTGNKKLDALNISVRPVITYWFMGLYCSAKTAVFVALILADTGIVDSIKLSWTETDMALFSGIMNFYFIGRVFDKK